MTTIQRRATLNKDQIKAIRKGMGWSATELASRFLITENTVRKWECGVSPVTGPALVLYRMMQRKLIKKGVIKPAKKKLAIATSSK